MKVFAIVVTYNGISWVDRCILSLQRSEVPVTTIVIDNGSTDGTQKVITDKYPGTRLIQAEKNLGFGKANNVGIANALADGADYILLLNQDAWIEPTTVSTLVAIQQQNPDYGILSPMHLNADFSRMDYNFSKYLAPEYCPNFYSDTFLNKLKELYEVDFVNAAAWLISRDCIQKVGLFDSLFYHYGEDVNYCQRLHYHKLKIGVCPFTRIVHDRNERVGVPANFMGLSYLKRRSMVRLANVNNPDFYKELLISQARIILHLLYAVLTLNRIKVGRYLQLMLFLVRNQSSIRKSLQRNRRAFNINEI